MGEITAIGVDSYPGGKDKYVDEVLDLVKDLVSNPVGWVILGAILHTPGKLTILPESERPPGSFDHKRTYTGSLAATFPIGPDGKLDYAHASPRGLKRDAKDDDNPAHKDRGKWYAGFSDDVDTDDFDERYKTAQPKWGDSLGGGSSDSIFFTPHGIDKSCARGYGMCAQQDDEVLLHEMVHALRDMQGLSDPVPTTPRYKNEEEFLAIVVTNVYISKKSGNKLLRRDYQRVGALEPPFNTSDGFLTDDENREILEYYAKYWQPVFGQLGNTNTAFNPFRKFKSPRKP